MINNFEVIIGIEVHVVLNTKTKMFSSSQNSHHGFPNTFVNEIDLGLPGVLPQPNKEAIKKGIWLAKAVNATINYQNIEFDRKNYFYLDLPKGYQITQQYNPIGLDGYIEINTNNGIKKIAIQRLHLEEDTAKQLNKGNEIYLDYNRSGCPLVEIVTYPVISNGYEASEYLKKLIQILKFNNVSDAKLEDGSLRADVNISIRPYGQKEFNNKVEIKNINSINNVIKAIDFEIDRQSKILLSGNIVEQETRRFDDSTMSTVHMRSKSNAVNYRYFHEANIIKIKITDEEFQQILKEKNKDISEIVEELRLYELNDSNIDQLLNNYEMYKVFDKIYNLTKSANQSFNWLAVEITPLLKKDNQDFNYLSENKINQIAKMINLINEQEINGKQAKEIIVEIYSTNKSVEEIIKEKGFQQIKDVDFLTKLIQKHIDENPKMINQYSENAMKVEKFLVGMVMKDTKAQANPQITMDIIIKLLSK